MAAVDVSFFRFKSVLTIYGLKSAMSCHFMASFDGLHIYY